MQRQNVYNDLLHQIKSALQNTYIAKIRFYPKVCESRRFLPFTKTKITVKKVALRNKKKTVWDIWQKQLKGIHNKTHTTLIGWHNTQQRRDAKRRRTNKHQVKMRVIQETIQGLLRMSRMNVFKSELTSTFWSSKYIRNNWSAKCVPEADEGLSLN